LARERGVGELGGRAGSDEGDLDAPLEREDPLQEVERLQAQGLAERSADDPGAVANERQRGAGGGLLDAGGQAGGRDALQRTAEPGAPGRLSLCRTKIEHAAQAPGSAGVSLDRKSVV